MTQYQSQDRVKLKNSSLNLGLQILKKVDFYWKQDEEYYQFNQEFLISNIEIDQDINLFLLAVTEEQFQREYFCRVPLSIITKQLV